MAREERKPDKRACATAGLPQARARFFGSLECLVGSPPGPETSPAREPPRGQAERAARPGPIRPLPRLVSSESATEPAAWLRRAASRHSPPHDAWRFGAPQQRTAPSPHAARTAPRRAGPRQPIDQTREASGPLGLRIAHWHAPRGL